MALHVDITDTMVRHLQGRGVFPKPKGPPASLISTNAGTPPFADYAVPRGETVRSGRRTGHRPQIERAKYNRARREQQELQMAQARGEVFEIALAESLFARMGRRSRPSSTRRRRSSNACRRR